MAQAARLNLRMQKELKLLLTDPPPAASFPSLSPSSSSSGPSLSSIDAQIEGPEGTVYAKGFFKLKIQIPDRYPFQPPMVTFATPIYHPNIDNGGRICLDILNLPPKGAWQPSLNISTVLTSIGLLLSEPNPDDGLMHEASQEYKYNRQAFDQKARAMTEKYARNGESETACGGLGSQTLLKPSIELAEAKADMHTSVKEKRVNEYEVCHKRLCGISRKLSLASSELDDKSNEEKGTNQVQSKHPYEKQMELEGLKQYSILTISDHNQTHEEPQRMRKKLSLEPFHEKHNNDVIEPVSNQCSSTSKSQSLIPSSKSWPLEQRDFGSEQKPNKDDDGESKSNSIETKLEKKQLLEFLYSNQGTGDDDEKEKLLSAAQQSDIQFHSCESQKNFLLLQTTRHNGREPHGETVNGDGNGFTRVKHRKLGLAGRKSSLGKSGSYQNQQKDNIENLAPNSSFPIAKESKNPTPSSRLSLASESGHCYERGAENYATYSDNSSRIVQRKPLQNLGYSSNSNNVNNQGQMQSMKQSKIPTLQHDSCYDEKQRPKQDCREKFAMEIKNLEGISLSSDADSVIVLDSEDSDEEQGRVARSKLSFARRRLLGT